MENKKKYPAVKMKAKRERALAKLKHCCIPATKIKTEIVEYEDGTKQVVNPKIKSNGNGPIGKAANDYKELRDKRKKYLREHFNVGRDKKKKKQPWYMLTRGKCYNYQTKNISWGQYTKSFKVESEYSKMYKRTIIPKLTKEEMIARLLSAKMNDWEKKNPMPSKEDMFYWKEMGGWINRYQNAFSRVASKLDLLKKGKMPDFVKELYNKYEIKFKEEFEEWWQNGNNIKTA